MKAEIVTQAEHRKLSQGVCVRRKFINETQLTPKEKVLYLHLALLAKDKVVTEQETLIDVLGIQENTYHVFLVKLEKLGYIRRNYYKPKRKADRKITIVLV